MAPTHRLTLHYIYLAVHCPLHHSPPNTSWLTVWNSSWNFPFLYRSSFWFWWSARHHQNRTERGEATLGFYAPQIWNKRSENGKTAGTPSSFKRICLELLLNHKRSCWWITAGPSVCCAVWNDLLLNCFTGWQMVRTHRLHMKAPSLKARVV